MIAIESASEERAADIDRRSATDHDETLVVDDRSSMSPSEFVEHRLIEMLRSSTLLVSQVQRQLRPRMR